ncbi:SseB family protein [Pseudoroseicyclus aestuarii]|uniref:Type III secretion system (T3SS) SseB-like protein n=1 Tax=Pseudoroseicyclus aestuarii TaxID=1795041 RepID=A0A318T5V7_9RHOB|nr:SseB family protein [Pseudoroseicyclus aestuarii]PYE83748.1 type III secretion system (T3SS) SseB-like protein [Pseudoroseicyclus aestuarii]
MTIETELSRLHAAAAADQGDEAARLAFLGRLADADLFLLLEAEAGGESIEPVLGEADGQAYALAFDTEEALSTHVGAGADHAAMPGRTLATMLAEAGIGLALNGRAEPEALIAPETLEWLVTTLAQAPERAEARPTELRGPGEIPEVLQIALEQALGTTGALAQGAVLARAVYEDGGEGLLLAILDPAPGAEQPLAAAVGEAMAFTGLPEGVLDVTFLASRSDLAQRFMRVGLRFSRARKADGPAPEAPAERKPPRLI